MGQNHPVLSEWNEDASLLPPSHVFSARRLILRFPCKPHTCSTPPRSAGPGARHVIAHHGGLQLACRAVEQNSSHPEAGGGARRDRGGGG